MSHFYPIYLDLRDRLVVIVGGGEVALEKVEGLLPMGARLRIVAPRLHPRLQRLVDRHAIEVWPRSYRRGDLKGAFLVFSERLGEAVHEALWQEAQAARQWLNVQDETRFCSFIAASVVRQGDLTVTISTAGRAPALAVRIRQRMERFFGRHYGSFLALCGRLRQPLAVKVPDFGQRRRLWYQLVDSEVLSLFGRGLDTEAEDRALQVLGLERHDLKAVEPPTVGPPCLDLPSRRPAALDEGVQP